MGKHRNSNSKSSHRKKHDARFRDKQYEYNRKVVSGEYDKSLSDSFIRDGIEKAGSPGELIPNSLGCENLSLNVIGSIIHSDSPLKNEIQPLTKEEVEAIVEDSEVTVIEISSEGSEIACKDEKMDLAEYVDKSVDSYPNSMKGARDMFVAQRIKRGMVFWYSANANIDKNTSPMIEVDGKKYQDSIEYGNRPWLVISTDEINRRNRMCTVVPLSSSISNHQDTSPNKVHVYFMGRETTILCEQIRTINTIELREYISTISDEVLEMVDEGVMYALGIKAKREFNSVNLNDALSKIDSVIESVVQSRIQKELESISKGKQEVVDEMILKISDGFENLYKSAMEGVRDDLQKRSSSKPVKNKIKEDKTVRDSGNPGVDKAIAENRPFTSYSTRVEKFYERYPSLNESGSKKAPEKKEIPRKTNMFHNVNFLPTYTCVDVPKKEGKIRKWTDELLAQFAYDFKYLPYSEIMVKWDIDTEKKVIDVARKVERKIFTGDMNGKTDFSSLKISFPGGVISYV